MTDSPPSTENLDPYCEWKFTMATAAMRCAQCDKPLYRGALIWKRPIRNGRHESVCADCAKAILVPEYERQRGLDEYEWLKHDQDHCKTGNYEQFIAPDGRRFRVGGLTMASLVTRR